MGEVDLVEFDMRLRSGECSERLGGVVAAMRSAAEQMGPVIWRAHSTPGGGWGLIAKRGNIVFCRLDPKPRKDHLQVLFSDANLSELAPLGTVADRRDQRWVAIGTLPDGSRRLVQDLLLQAYARAAAQLERRSTTASQPRPAPCA
jgi:hypothetical protein